MVQALGTVKIEIISRGVRVPIEWSYSVNKQVEGNTLGISNYERIKGKMR